MQIEDAAMKLPFKGYTRAALQLTKAPLGQDDSPENKKYVLQRKRATMILKRPGITLATRAFSTVKNQIKSQSKQQIDQQKALQELESNIPYLKFILSVPGEDRTQDQLLQIYQLTKCLGFYNKFSKSFNNTDLTRLLASFSYIDYNKGHLLTVKGDRSERVYYLIQGTVGVINPSSDKADQVRLQLMQKKAQKQQEEIEALLSPKKFNPNASPIFRQSKFMKSPRESFSPNKSIKSSMGTSENDQQASKSDIVAVLKQGAVMGDLGVVFFSERTATIECLSNCMFMYIDSELFRLTMKNEILKTIKEKCKEIILFGNLQEWSKLNMASLIPYIQTKESLVTNTVIYSPKIDDFNLYYVNKGQVNLYFQFKSEYTKTYKNVLVKQVLEGQYFGDEEGFIDTNKMLTAVVQSNETELIFLNKQQILNNYPVYLKKEDLLDISQKRREQVLHNILNQVNIDQQLHEEQHNYELHQRKEELKAEEKASIKDILSGKPNKFKNLWQIKHKFLHKNMELQAWEDIVKRNFNDKIIPVDFKAKLESQDLSILSKDKIKEWNDLQKRKRENKAMTKSQIMARQRNQQFDLKDHLYTKCQKGLNGLQDEMTEIRDHDHSNILSIRNSSYNTPINSGMNSQSRSQITIQGNEVVNSRFKGNHKIQERSAEQQDHVIDRAKRKKSNLCQSRTAENSQVTQQSQKGQIQQAVLDSIPQTPEVQDNDCNYTLSPFKQRLDSQLERSLEIKTPSVNNLYDKSDLNCSKSKDKNKPMKFGMCKKNSLPSISFNNQKAKLGQSNVIDKEQESQNQVKTSNLMSLRTQDKLNLITQNYQIEEINKSLSNIKIRQPFYNEEVKKHRKQLSLKVSRVTKPLPNQTSNKILKLSSYQRRQVERQRDIMMSNNPFSQEKNTPSNARKSNLSYSKVQDLNQERKSKNSFPELRYGSQPNLLTRANNHQGRKSLGRNGSFQVLGTSKGAMVAMTSKEQFMSASLQSSGLGRPQQKQDYQIDSNQKVPKHKFRNMISNVKK